MKKLYTCRTDRAFKEVFMKKDNKDILIALLEVCLSVKIMDIEYLNLEDNVDNIHVRRKSYDLRLSTDIGRLLIEVNSNIYDYSRARQVSYLSNEYSHIVKSGEDYSEKDNVIQINFTYGFMKEFRNKNKYLYDNKGLRIYRIMDDDRKEFVKNFKILEFNMDYYKNIWYNNDTKKINKYKYIIMLDLQKESLMKLSKDKVVNKYMSEIIRVNKDPNFIEYMSYEEDQRKRLNTMLRKSKEEGEELGEKRGRTLGITEGRNIGIAEGRTLGITEGYKNANKENAYKMREEGIPISIIQRVTGINFNINK